MCCFLTLAKMSAQCMLRQLTNSTWRKRETYYTTKIEPWDVSAGVLLVQEAGGRVTDFRGDSWKPNKSDLVLSNGKVHSAMLNLLEQRTPTEHPSPK
ncbi:MAG: hypothetical protein COS88_03540 [Chloroflexi bacterium CG07_land_8_20_14_0_80_51_10]|nr:MAG: hypothetical protein COS88_03540 [Chloroflexi bacterium CG07_land_8_20_14_0_80_51_10]